MDGRGTGGEEESIITLIILINCQIPHPIHLMVTEKVREEARRHFSCDRLEGAELENQGGDGTAMTHWEKRLFEVCAG